ncbi:hypothetical protein RJ639_046822 [Escallonia herrerae]|uniref:WD repeat-containing protein 25 n=1 Tax=Escallonia herrerae TaxID=1293975 RepID=A0AA88W7J6_9ASTE|nr:hypothetical protein RJ639_046822 [Escallonia herrerae]
MEQLSSAYSTASDDDEERETPALPPSKRPKPEVDRRFTKPFPAIRPYTAQNLPTEPPIPGRYVSKRERATLASDPPAPHSNILSPVAQSPAHLLASAGMDHTVCIWNVWSNNQKKARVLNHHNAAVKDVKWSEQGLSVLSCGYDCSSRLVDVEKGLETQVFKEDQVVGVVKFHPNNSDLFLSGGSKGLIRLWDIRTGKVVHQYNRGLGPVLDVEFTNDTKQFISSSDVSRSNVSENSIIVWDVLRQVPLSNQLLSEMGGLIFVKYEGDGFLEPSLREKEVYVEAYTCPCIRCHPFDPYFVAQSHGNYIAIFSVKPPFRLDKYKRYDDHAVSGFPIKCNFNSNGEKLASGSSDGCIYLYNSKSCELIKKFKACIDVAFHPVMPNVIASCSWSGDVSLNAQGLVLKKRTHDSAAAAIVITFSPEHQSEIPFNNSAR